MTLYEFNQVGYNSMPPMTKEELDEAKTLVKEYLRKTQSDYYMLLNNEEHYYTVFHRVTRYPIDTADAVCNRIFSIAQELGTLKAVEIDNTFAGVQFWITDNWDDKTKMYGLFDYARGVICI